MIEQQKRCQKCGSPIHYPYTNNSTIEKPPIKTCGCDTITAKAFTSTIAKALPFPVGDLYFRQDDRVLKYKPLKDITTYELALIMKMIAVGITARESLNARYKYISYVEDNNLQRHFEEE